MRREFPLNTDLQIDESSMPCPYLSERRARLVYWLPQNRWSKTEFDRRLAEGQRRHGSLVYEPHCEGCDQCISLRIPIQDFRFSRSQKRVWKRGQKILRAELGAPVCDDRRLSLLNAHSQWRGWSDDGEIPVSHYEFTFVSSISNSFEIAYYLEQPGQESRLIGIAICDEGETGLSAVYTYYEPEFAHLSLGTYSVLFQIDLCRQLQIPFLYLGYYVAECRSLNYKAKFLPHEQLRGGLWHRINQADEVPTARSQSASGVVPLDPMPSRTADSRLVD